MRLFASSLVGLVLVAAAASAQQPGGSGSPIIPVPGSGSAAPGGPQPANLNPGLDPKNNRLDALLLLWEQRMKGVDSAWVPDCTRTEKYKDGTIRVYKGEARYLKPNYAALRMIRQDNPSLYELYVSNGTFLYEFRPTQKLLRIHDVPKPQMGQFQDNFLTFLFGVTGVDAKRRYELTLTKEDENFIYLGIKSRLPADMREFTQAQLVLQTKSMLPRRLWFLNPNENEITWDIPNLKTELKLQPKDFTPPEPPKDWEVKRVRNDDVSPTPGKPTGNAQPRIIRPSGK